MSPQTLTCLVLHLGGRPPPTMPGTAGFTLPRASAVAALEMALARVPEAELVLFSMAGAPWPLGHLDRMRQALAGCRAVALGVAGVVYPDLFDGLAATAWRPTPTQIPPGGRHVNELALGGMALAGCPVGLLRRIAECWQDSAPAVLPYLAALVALELHRAGWPRLLLPGDALKPPARDHHVVLPPAITLAILEFGGLRHLPPDPGS